MRREHRERPDSDFARPDPPADKSVHLTAAALDDTPAEKPQHMDTVQSEELRILVVTRRSVVLPRGGFRQSVPPLSRSCLVSIPCSGIKHQQSLVLEAEESGTGF